MGVKLITKKTLEWQCVRWLQLLLIIIAAGNLPSELLLLKVMLLQAIMPPVPFYLTMLLKLQQGTSRTIR
eukprot:4426095-Amphidinium_carterae.1